MTAILFIDTESSDLLKEALPLDEAMKLAAAPQPPASTEKVEPVNAPVGEPDFIASLQGYASMCESAARGEGLSPDDCKMVVGKLRDAAFVVDALQKLRGWEPIADSTTESEGMTMIETDKTYKTERERFAAWWDNPGPCDETLKGVAWRAWQARAALDTGAALDGVILQMRERISSVRENIRRKMNAASDRAEMAASVGDMKEVSINSTESERHREAFVALNVAIDIIDQTEFLSTAPQPPASAIRTIPLPGGKVEG
ncbi:hypothetical protein [Xanthobacter sediminis]|uniref:hypothetical protein n=1 Tax=Xanthobacter sediminis TaxID=3119926 RepID=UPI003726EF88